jgi:hypothetical protein
MEEAKTISRPNKRKARERERESEEWECGWQYFWIKNEAKAIKWNHRCKPTFFFQFPNFFKFQKRKKTVTIVSVE